jgi:hypothetical protein
LHVVQDVSREGLQLLCRIDQLPQDRIRIHLEHPRGAPDTQSLGQAREDTHNELDRGALAVKERAEGFEKIATTDYTQQLPPGTATGMAIGTEIAPAHPAPIGAVRVRAEMGGGVDLAAASPLGYDARRWS